ncbi:MAG: beta-galactosidase [Ruminococcaceae bacterium]|nr:beta-galactosidase [Oscillospiraceae bacterium]
MSNYKKPFIGAAYYPEDWDESEMDYDIQKMNEAGVTCARIAEFAWSRIEPQPGEYDFGWIHTAIDKLSAAGISVILCTPTATPPIWLSKLHPDVTFVPENGIPRVHGGRRHCCSNNPHYIEYSKRIVKKMGEEFGSDERIIGWQLDNEINAQNCTCPDCVALFREHLRKKYGTIENMNKAWNLTLWSQEYSSFSDVNIPVNAWHNPHIKLEYRLFQSDSHSNYIGMQADILKKYTKAPIGTDTMPVNTVDYETLTEKCDIIQYNHYDKPKDLHGQRFWFDFMRSLKDRPFWNTETSTCWNGSEMTSHDLKPYGFCRVNTWLPVMLGGEAAMYWLWRTHWAGHELMHGAVLAPSGRPLHIFEEVQRTADEFEKCADFINNTKVDTEVALHFTSLNWNLFLTQGVITENDYRGRLYNKIYTPIVNAGLRPDVIGARKDLSSYKLLFSSYMMSIDQGDLTERIHKWVEDGGVWVVGPMSDIRSGIGTRFTNRPYNSLEEFAGVRQAYEAPDRDKLIKSVWKNGEEFVGNEWYELFEADEDALVTVTEGYPTLVGKASIIRKKVGKGVVYIIGTVPSEADMRKIIDMACADAGVTGYEISGTLVVAPRKGEKDEGLIVAECKNESGSIVLKDEMTDIITGKKYSGKVELSPYDVLVLKK